MEKLNQMEAAKRGIVTDEMTAVAKYERRDAEWIRERVADGRIVVPRNAVVVSGSKPILRDGKPVPSGVHLYCPVIVKYRDEKTSGSITLEDLLR